MRLLLSETDKRVVIKLNKSIKPGITNGIMEFGEKNDYPNIIERIINSSISARAIANINARFLIGNGFENEQLNLIPVGKDVRGKDITMLNLLRQIANDLSVYNGCYIHTSVNLGREVTQAKYLPFKNCRFSKQDDAGYCSSIAYYDNWEKDTGVKFDKEKIKTYPIFNLNETSFASIVSANGGESAFKGMVDFLFFDNQFLYPLAKIDPVYMDADSEGQIEIFKNNQLRNGFLDKIVFRVQPPQNVKEQEGFIEKIKSFVGVDGEPVLILEDEIDQTTGEIKKTGAFAIDKITTSVNDKLFESWEKSLANNIRKAYDALPALLIDYEESKLGTTSGEAINQAVNFYNQMTANYRTAISEFIKEIFVNSENEKLSKNNNWAIKPLNLYDNGTTTKL